MSNNFFYGSFLMISFCAVCVDGMQRVVSLLGVRSRAMATIDQAQFERLACYAFGFLRDNGDRLAYIQESGAVKINIPLFGACKAEFGDMLEAIQLCYCPMGFENKKIVRTNVRSSITHVMNGGYRFNQYRCGGGEGGENLYDVYRVFPGKPRNRFIFCGAERLKLVRSGCVEKDSVVQLGNDCVHQVLNMRSGTCMISFFFKDKARDSYDLFIGHGEALDPKIVDKQLLSVDNASVIIEQIMRAMLG